MCINVKSNINFRDLPNKGFFVSLLLVAVLFFSCFIHLFSNSVAPFALGAYVRRVSNEMELRNAIYGAVVPTVIALTADITITETSLVIPEDKEITLKSAKSGGFWKLLGASDLATIFVGGKLTLESIIVTHVKDASNSGVYVNGGSLILSGGEISGNTAAEGGGVYNTGTFVMTGGTITNNTAGRYGGGVANFGTFTMLSGDIYNNTVAYGGGVYNAGYSFELLGGRIVNNSASRGGGIYSVTAKSFSMSGGEVSGNTAYWGGGVYNYNSNFTMSGGVISDNTAYHSGGGVFLRFSEFTMSGGKISDNTVLYSDNDISGSGFGGGVSNWEGTVELLGGKISGNTAPNGGGNVYTLGDVYYFGVRDIVLITCVGVVLVVLGIVFSCVFYVQKKRRAPVGEKLGANNLEG